MRFQLDIFYSLLPGNCEFLLEGSFLNYAFFKTNWNGQGTASCLQNYIDIADINEIPWLKIVEKEYSCGFLML